MNEQNLGKKFEETFGIQSNEEHATRFDHEWAKHWQKVGEKFRKLVKLKNMYQELITTEQNLGKMFWGKF